MRSVIACLLTYAASGVETKPVQVLKVIGGCTVQVQGEELGSEPVLVRLTFLRIPTQEALAKQARTALDDWLALHTEGLAQTVEQGRAASRSRPARRRMRRDPARRRLVLGA